MTAVLCGPCMARTDARTSQMAHFRFDLAYITHICTHRLPGPARLIVPIYKPLWHPHKPLLCPHDGSYGCFQTRTNHRSLYIVRTQTLRKLEVARILTGLGQCRSHVIYALCFCHMRPTGCLGPVWPGKPYGPFVLGDSVWNPPPPMCMVACIRSFYGFSMCFKPPRISETCACPMGSVRCTCRCHMGPCRCNTGFGTPIRKTSQTAHAVRIRISKHHKEPLRDLQRVCKIILKSKRGPYTYGPVCDPYGPVWVSTGLLRAKW